MKESLYRYDELAKKAKACHGAYMAKRKGLNDSAFAFRKAQDAKDFLESVKA